MIIEAACIQLCTPIEKKGILNLYNRRRIREKAHDAFLEDRERAKKNILVSSVHFAFFNIYWNLKNLPTLFSNFL